MNNYLTVGTHIEEFLNGMANPIGSHLNQWQ